VARGAHVAPADFPHTRVKPSDKFCLYAVMNMYSSNPSVCLAPYRVPAPQQCAACLDGLHLE
jgi:hypothetical protein